MLEDLIEFITIMQEVQGEYEKFFQVSKNYLREIMDSSLPIEIKKNILEYELDRLEVKTKRYMVKKLRELSDEFPTKMREDAEKTNKSVENYIDNIERRWVVYGNPLGSGAGNEIKPTVSKKQIIDENYTITMQLFENVRRKI